MKKLYVYCIHNPRTFSSSRGVGRRICACRCITAHPFWSSRLEFVLQQPITDSPKSKFTEKVPILYGRPTLSWILVSKSHSYYQIAFNLWWLSPKNYEHAPTFLYEKYYIQFSDVPQLVFGKVFLFGEGVLQLQCSVCYFLMSYFPSVPTI